MTPDELKEKIEDYGVGIENRVLTGMSVEHTIPDGDLTGALMKTQAVAREFNQVVKPPSNEPVSQSFNFILKGPGA